jgi:hypothetical protein
MKNRLVLGINEVIVYGSTTDQFDALDPYNALEHSYYGVKRKLEFAYLIPFVPFKFAEHLFGSLHDNALMSFDGDLHFPDNFRWYGEFLIDDMLSPWQMFSSDWGNKLAFTGGMQYFGTFMQNDVTASIEYSRVEPWVYTHFSGGSGNYAHFGECLGMPLGPNSDALVVALEDQVTKRNALGVRLTATRKNASVRGGSITDVFQQAGSLHPDSPIKHFLGPGTVSSTLVGITWKYAPFGRFTVSSELDYDFSEQYGSPERSEGVYATIKGGLVF